MTTIAERVLEALADGQPRDDDELAAVLGIRRQSVNPVCRALADSGRLRRYKSPAGKWVNNLDLATPAPVHPDGPATTPNASITEDELKQALVTHLEARGYRCTVAWGRTRGIDIDANDGKHRLVIEAKGEVAAGGAQTHNYFLNAIGELVQRMSDDSATYALALPDVPQNNGLVGRLPALARQRLGLVVFFVARDSLGWTVRQDSPPLQAIE